MAQENRNILYSESHIENEKPDTMLHLLEATREEKKQKRSLVSV